MSRALFLIFFFGIILQVQCQNSKLLILDKVGSKKRITYTIGDEIILKTKKDQFEITETIVDIEDSVIVFFDYFIHVKDVEYVKTIHTNGFLSPSNGPKLIVAGIFLFTIDQLNHSLRQGNDFRFDPGITIASATLIGFGIFWTSLKVRKFKPGENRRIRTFVM